MNCTHIRDRSEGACEGKVESVLDSAAYNCTGAGDGGISIDNRCIAIDNCDAVATDLQDDGILWSPPTIATVE